jgi:hypothetical protein
MAKPAYSANWNAEMPQLGMPALWRLVAWGGFATVALFVAVIFSYSNAVWPDFLGPRKLGRRHIATSDPDGDRASAERDRGGTPALGGGRACAQPLAVTAGLALQLPFPKVSESMGNHDSKIVDAGGVD